MRKSDGAPPSCAGHGPRRKPIARQVRAAHPAVSPAGTAASSIEWMQRNGEAPARLATMQAPLLRSQLEFKRPTPMNLPRQHHAHTAARGESCVGAVRLGSGITPGLVVVDSNRPAAMAGTARGLLRQFGAAH